MRPRVAVLGDALLDVHVSGASLRAGSDVPATIRLEPGGQGANVAVRLARRGVQVRLACALANDAAGRVVRAALEAEGVELVAAPPDRTGSVVVLVDPEGERSMLSQRAPLAPTLDATLLRALAMDADWVAVSGYLLLEPDASAVAASLADLPARRLVLGCAVDRGDVDRWRAATAACRPSLLVLNAQEAALLTAADAPEVAGPRLAHDLGACIVVTGPAGAVAFIDDARVTASVGPAVDPAVDPIDTTGAGDAFTAALLATIGTADLDSPTLERALVAAVEAGTAATRVVGAQGRVPGEDDPDTLVS